MQQPTIRLRAVDIGNAIIEQEMALQGAHTYLAAILKNKLNGRVTIPRDTFESLQSTEWEVATSVNEDGVQFELLEGKELINKRLGRTSGGLVVPGT